MAMPDQLESGSHLGQYTLLQSVAAGGMGEVFLAKRHATEGPVALKVLRSELAVDRQFVDMLIDEANIARQLDHPSLVPVRDFGYDRGHYYLAMDFVEGLTVESLIERHNASGIAANVSVALHVAVELCRGLNYAHRLRNDQGEPLGIIHRDVTPANILLSVEGAVKLTDFGIARAKGRLHQTQAGVIKGKFGYMAPEIARYESVDARADLFCVGIVTYLLCTHRHPVDETTVIEAIQAFENKRVQPPSAVNPSVDSGTDEVVMKALEPLPDLRWQSAEEMGRALQRVLVERPESWSATLSPRDLLASQVRQLVPEVMRMVDAHRASFGLAAASATSGRASTATSLPSQKDDATAPGARLMEPVLPGPGAGSGAATAEPTTTEPRDETTYVDGADPGDGTQPTPAVSLPPKASTGSSPTVLGVEERVVVPQPRPPARTLVPYTPRPPVTAAPKRPRNFPRRSAAVLAALLGVGFAWLWFGTTAFWPRLRIRTEPGSAKVVVDGRTVASVSPVTVVLEPGKRHWVELSREGYHSTRRQLTSAVSRGRTYRLEVELAPLPPTLRVTPVAGKVYVNGSFSGAGKKVQLLEIPSSGSVRIRVESEGHQPYEAEFSNPKLIPPVLNVPLEPI